MITLEKHYLHIIIPVKNCFTLLDTSHTRYITMNLYLYKKRFLWHKYNTTELSIHTDYIINPYYDGEYSTNQLLESNTNAIRDYIEMIEKSYRKGMIDYEEAKILINHQVEQYNGKCISLEDYREDI